MTGSRDRDETKAKDEDQRGERRRQDGTSSFYADESRSIYNVPNVACRASKHCYIESKVVLPKRFKGLSFTTPIFQHENLDRV